MPPSRFRVVVALIVAVAGLYYFATQPSQGARAYGDSGCGEVSTRPLNLALEPAKAMILCLLNDERAKHGLAALTENAVLERASDLHSADMVRRQYFAHETPDGVTPADRMTAAGYITRPGGMTGENLAWGEDTKGSPAAMVDGWMHSPGHRENILRPEFREVGVGIARGAAARGRSSGGNAAVYTTDFGG